MQTKIRLNNGNISQYGLSTGITQSESSGNNLKELSFEYNYRVTSNINGQYCQKSFTKLVDAKSYYKSLNL